MRFQTLWGSSVLLPLPPKRSRVMGISPTLSWRHHPSHGGNTYRATYPFPIATLTKHLV